MPRPDPLPRPDTPRHDPPPKAASSLTGKLKRALRLLGLFAALVGIIAGLLVSRGQAQWHVHMLIATVFGMTLAVFIGGALMLLIFYSAASGHDERAARHDPENDQ